MAFVSEEINTKEDKDYFSSIALKSMTGQELYPDWWTIDRERDIVLYERGGGSFEIPAGYGLYIGGCNVEIEVVKSTKGNRYESNLIAYYFVKKIEIPQTLIDKNYEVDQIINIIQEAFQAMGVPNVEREKVQEVNVKILDESY